MLAGSDVVYLASILGLLFIAAAAPAVPSRLAVAVAVFAVALLAARRLRPGFAERAGAALNFLSWMPLVEERREQLATWAALGVYLAALSTAMLIHDIYLQPDHVLFFATVLAFFFGHGSRFLRSWLPFFLILFGYEAMRGLAPALNARVHVTPLIAAEEALFGSPVPTVRLQRWLYTPGSLAWYDYLAVGFYSMHFALPFTFAYVLWLLRPALFPRFTAVLAVVSYAGFVTFLAFPAAPPWMAAEQGYLPHVYDIMSARHGGPQFYVLESLYDALRGNPVAAMPSMHAAYPVLVFGFALRHWGRKALPLAVFPLGIGFACVYLGHHYVIDVLAGAAYAGAALRVSERWLEKAS